MFFFCQAADGMRDGHVTGVQTCALPIFERGIRRGSLGLVIGRSRVHVPPPAPVVPPPCSNPGERWSMHGIGRRSEERRVGKDRWLESKMQQDTSEADYMVVRLHAVGGAR